MARTHPMIPLCALLAALPIAPLRAQTASPTADAPGLPEVRVEGRAATPDRERASVGGLSDAPVAETPQSISILRASQARELGVNSLSSLIRSETSVGDSYNTVGYIESLQIRGFLLDNALNYRRDGFAISNHAPLAIENKESIEILKGVSGIQSGTSAPGGLVNYVLKRPTFDPLRELTFGLSERGSVLMHGDFGGRFGEAKRFGYRINVAAEERNPQARDARGDRQFVSGFFDMRLPGNALLEAEFEHNDLRQRSVPGFGLLDRDGDGVAQTLPAPVNPRINLNAQPWSLPFESRSTVASLRFQQALSSQWLYGVRYSHQRIRTNDRLAFPDGCSAGANYLYPGFCGDYSFDVYDFRSENEIRSTNSAEAYLRGEFRTGPVQHELGAGVKSIRYSERYEPMQAYNWVGIGNVFSPVVLPENPVPGDLNTLRDARTREIYLTDTMRFGADWSLWLGVRHTRLERSSERTDGSRATHYDQSFTTPFGALGYRPWKGGLAYVSAGSGVESEVVPNRPALFTNSGVALPALRSRQAEIGFKQQLPGAGLLSAALFRVTKPWSGDIPEVDASGTPTGRSTRVADGREARHQGLELSWIGRPMPALTVQAQATFLDATTTRSLDPDLVGKRTTNAPRVSASLMSVWQVASVPGMTWTNRLIWSGAKPVTRDNAVMLPSYWQLDTAFAWRQRTTQGSALTWRVGIDNVFDRRYWRDAPTQYWGGIYLLPALPRTLRGSVTMSF